MALSAKLFISDKIEERSITLDDGTKEVLFFRHLPNTAFERYALWTQSADEEVVSAAAARLVAMSLCEPDGKPALDDAQAKLIKPRVMRRLVSTVLEVNGYGKAAKEGNG